MVHGRCNGGESGDLFELGNCSIRDTDGLGKPKLFGLFYLFPGLCEVGNNSWVVKKIEIYVVEAKLWGTSVTVSGAIRRIDRKCNMRTSLRDCLSPSTGGFVSTFVVMYSFSRGILAMAKALPTDSSFP